MKKVDSQKPDQPLQRASKRAPALLNERREECSLSKVSNPRQSAAMLKCVRLIGDVVGKGINGTDGQTLRSFATEVRPIFNASIKAGISTALLATVTRSAAAFSESPQTKQFSKRQRGSPLNAIEAAFDFRLSLSLRQPQEIARCYGSFSIPEKVHADVIPDWF